MMSAIAGQPHPDVTAFLKRVATGSASVRAPIQVALNEFVKKCYQLGVRSNTGASHQIRMCYIPCTSSLAAGTYEKLWFPAGNQTAVTAGGTIVYSESAGITVNGRTVYLDSKLAANTMTINSCMLFFHNLTEGTNKDFLGANDGAAGLGTTNVFLINPRWTDNVLYFDVGNSVTGTTGGRINVAVSNTIGLILGYKNSASQAVYMRGAQAVLRTTAPTTGLTMSTDTITAVYAASSDATTARNIGGFGSGTPMLVGNIAPFTTAWNNLQTAMGRAVA